MDDVKCKGTEKSLQDCKADWGNKANCKHDKDVYIKCDKDKKKEIDDGMIRSGWWWTGGTLSPPYCLGLEQHLFFAPENYQE